VLKTETLFRAEKTGFTLDFFLHTKFIHNCTKIGKFREWKIYNFKFLKILNFHQKKCLHGLKKKNSNNFLNMFYTIFFTRILNKIKFYGINSAHDRNNG
jgi:hypothetical protein